MSTRVADIKFDRKKILHRPTLYKEEYCETILELAKRPMNFVEIAVELGVCTETMMEWGRVHKSFSVALARAKEIHKSWFSDQMKKGLFDSTEKHTENGVTELKSSRFNAQTAKLYGYMSFGITENSVNSYVDLTTEYAKKETTNARRQEILSEQLAAKAITVAQYNAIQSGLTAACKVEENTELKQVIEKLESQKA